jgi:hypothetical protein
MKNEVEAYINGAYLKERQAQLDDVYVTNHEPKQRKYNTNGAQEDEEFYRYKLAV